MAKPLPTPRPGSPVAVARALSGRWRISYYTPDGTYVRRTIGTRREADLAAAKLRHEAWEARAMGVEPTPTMTLQQLADAHLERGARKASLSHDRARWQTVLEHWTPSRDVGSIRPADVDALRTWLLSQPARRPGQARGRGKTTPARSRARTAATLSPATANRYLALLSSAFAIAIERGVLAESPVRRGHKLREQERDRIASPAELTALLEVARPELRLAIVLACETVLRRGSLMAITWSRLDLEARTLAIPTSKNGEPIRVPLSKRAAETLSAWPRTSEHVLDVHADTISGWFGDLCRTLGIADLRFHDLRHTAATRLIDAGIDWTIVMKLGGWKSVAAFRRYRSIPLATLRAALDRVS